MSELADRIAAEVRAWYEDHREHWIDRMGEPGKPDEFMLKLVAEVERVVHELTPPPPAPVHQEAHKKTGRK